MRRIMMLVMAVVLPVVAGVVIRTARFDPSDLVITRDNGYDNIALPRGVTLIQPGAPAVPRVVEAIAIPAGAVPVGMELLEVEWTTLPGTYRIGPAQPDFPLPRAGEKLEVKLWPPDPVIYSSSEPYPSSVAFLSGFGTMAGFRIAHVELHPVRYIPRTGQVQLATRIGYRLEYVEGGAGVAVATKRQQELFGDMVRLLVVNPEDVSRFAPRVSRANSLVLPPGDYEYVVITEAPMDTVFQRLADWKTLKGVPGTVVRVSWINGQYPGYDLQEKIRNFIKDAYETWGTSYVLLGGQGDYQTSGQNIIPTRMANYSNNGDEPCDLYYAGLDGSWDANGNHVYGEIPDSADMYSDVFVGRAPVYNVVTAQNFVNKLLTYEQHPPRGFIRKMMLPTGILWSSYEERPMQESICRMTGPAWSDQRLYERAGALSHQAVMDSMNAGCGMGHWEGHGNESGIYMSGGSVAFFTSDDADVLVNGDKTGIAVSIACDCAAWDWVPGGDCLAEHMVMRVGGGCIATIMNTRYGYGAIGPGGNYVPGPSERLDTTFFAGVLEYGRYHTGEALGYSKACWAPYADSLYQYAKQRYCIYDLNLIGDPETPLWTDEPDSLIVQHPGVITIGNNVPYTVTVRTQGAAPVESALVILRKSGEVNVSGRTNSSGQITLLVSALTPGPMTLTVNARDHFVFIDTVMVISTARYVAYLRSYILDPGPGGNGDSIMNPGETVKIPTWVKNWGQQTANGVTGRLRTRDPNAQVTDSVKSFGNIAAGDSAWTGENGFGLHVNSGLPNGYAVACSLICKDELDTTWVSNVTFYVGTPVLAKGRVAVRDSSQGGNNNGRVDPGEIAELEIAIRNTGLGHGYNCQAKLRSGDSRFQVLDSTASYGTIRKGDSVINRTDRFTVHADASIPLETPISCTLHISADGGYSWTQQFVIVIGEIRQTDPIPDGPRTPARYYAYDDVDVGYEHHPEYNWVEIKTVGTRLTYPQNDDVLVVDLPVGFGPFRFYGQSYTQLSVSADGWICPGYYTTTHYTNRSLPDPSTPPGMICVNWDDLYPNYNNANFVYYYHDTANHRFIIEYDSVSYYNPTSVKDKFEVIFYDTTVTTPTGDNVIVCQYMTANRYISSTLGIEDPSRTIAIQALFDNSYHRGCAPIAPRRAIAYRTDPPSGSGLTEKLGLLNLTGIPLRAYPNPVPGKGIVAWNVRTEGRVVLRVFDVTGREVRVLIDKRLKPGSYSVVWDGRAGTGRQVAAGVYFYRLETASGTWEQKVTLTR